MEFTQSRFTDKITLRFERVGFSYFMKDNSGTKTVFIKYTDLNMTQRYEIEHRSAYLRNVGILWVVLGIALSLPIHQINFWLYIGVACLAVYQFMVTKYSVIPSSLGNVLIIKDEQHDAIISELGDRMKKAILFEFGDIDYNRTFEDERKKYKSLLDIGVISETEFNRYLESMEADRTKFRQELPGS
jgi:hypothetical protein